MFRVDLSQNRISKLDQTRFSALNLREREHLQEWLANQPDALGENLLIIQKEFDGFADTRERLDLLALDKNGHLVVIENKLDDSGRDVSWQALKYAAYVSSLTKAQIIDIYQQYLDRQPGGGSAAQKICEFLNLDELEKVVLNPGSTQRLFFIAANFRKEVTSTVLWLRENRIDARCFKVVPYLFREELFVDIQPVIPTPEAAEFMIRMAEKEIEVKEAQSVQRKTNALRRDYWVLVLEKLREDGVAIYQSISPSNEGWISAGSGIAYCSYRLLFQKKEIRVEFAFSRPDQAENKWLFDELYLKKHEIEAAFGHELVWLRLETYKESRLFYAFPCDGYQQDNWPDYTLWHAEYAERFEAALRGPLAEVGHKFKLQGKS